MKAVGRSKLKFIFRVASFSQFPDSFHNLLRANMTENKNEDVWDYNSYICSII